jgi:hypothetical protein
VARVLDYLASEDVVAEFYGRSLFVPGHLGLARKGLDYKDASLMRTQRSRYSVTVLTSSRQRPTSCRAIRRVA